SRGDRFRRARSHRSAQPQSPRVFLSRCRSSKRWRSIFAFSLFGCRGSKRALLTFAIPSAVASPVLERRLSLRYEGLHAFLLVLRREQRVEQAALEENPLRKR